MLRLAPVALLLVACVDDDVRGPWDTGAGEQDEEEGLGFERPDDVDDDTEDPADTGAPPDTGSPPEGEACYPGPDGAWGLCLPVVAPATMPEGYDYPPPLSGSERYRAPEAWLDLQVLDPVAPLSPHFVLGEIAAASKGRYAVVQPHAVAALQAVRDEVGVLVVNSGYRSPSYNAGVGGVTWSRHLYGDAFDLDPVETDLEALAAACTAEGAGYVGVYATHIHCDWRDDPLSEAFFGPPGRSAAAAARPVHDARIERQGPHLVAPAIGWPEGEPLRTWTAYDASGSVIDRHRTATYQPPAEAAEVEVEVGMVLTRAMRLD